MANVACLSGKWPSEAHLQKCAGGHLSAPTGTEQGVGPGEEIDGRLAVHGHLLPSQLADPLSSHSVLRGKKMTPGKKEKKMTPEAILYFPRVTHQAGKRDPALSGLERPFGVRREAHGFGVGQPCVPIRLGLCLCTVELSFLPEGLLRGSRQLYCEQPRPRTCGCRPPTPAGHESPSQPQCRPSPVLLSILSSPVLGASGNLVIGGFSAEWDLDVDWFHFKFLGGKKSF